MTNGQTMHTLPGPSQFPTTRCAAAGRTGATTVPPASRGRDVGPQARRLGRLGATPHQASRSQLGGNWGYPACHGIGNLGKLFGDN